MSSDTETAGVDEDKRAKRDNAESLVGAEGVQQELKSLSHLRNRESDPLDQDKGKGHDSVQIGSGSDTKLILFKLCNSNEWDAVLQLVRDNPQAAASPHQGTTYKANTILHKALGSKTIDASTRLAIVTELLRVAPETATIKNHHGSLPLHVATRNHVKMEAHVREQVISVLIEAYPAALTTGDASRNTPLHVACDTWCSAREAKQLIDAAPAAASMTNERRMLPIHIACARRCSPDKLKLLLKAYPDGIDAAAGDGATPVDIAKSSATDKHPNFAMLQVFNDVMQERLESATRRRAGNKRSAASQHYQRPVSEGITDGSGVTTSVGGMEDDVSEGRRDSAGSGSGDGILQNLVWQQPTAVQEEQEEAHQQQLLERGRLAGVLPPRRTRDEGDVMFMLGQRARLIVAQTRMHLAGGTAGTALTHSQMLQRLQDEHEFIIREMYRLHQEQRIALEQLREEMRNLEMENEALREMLAREGDSQP